MIETALAAVKLSEPITPSPRIYTNGVLMHSLSDPPMQLSLFPRTRRVVT